MQTGYILWHFALIGIVSFYLAAQVVNSCFGKELISNTTKQERAMCRRSRVKTISGSHSSPCSLLWQLKSAEPECLSATLPQTLHLLSVKVGQLLSTWYDKANTTQPHSECTCFSLMDTWSTLSTTHDPLTACDMITSSPKNSQTDSSNEIDFEK